MPDTRRITIELTYEEAMVLGRVFMRALPSMADVRLSVERRRAQEAALLDVEPDTRAEDGA